MQLRKKTNHQRLKSIVTGSSGSHSQKSLTICVYLMGLRSFCFYLIQFTTWWSSAGSSAPLFIQVYRMMFTVLLSRHRAEKVKATTEAVKKALMNSKTAQTSAEKAIMTAKADITETENRLAQVSS